MNERDDQPELVPDFEDMTLERLTNLVALMWGMLAALTQRIHALEQRAAQRSDAQHKGVPEGPFDQTNTNQ